MVTSPSSFPSSPSSPSTSSSSATDYTRSSSDEATGSGSTSSAGSMSSTLHPSSTAAGSATPELMDRVVRGAHETVDKLADKAKPQLQRLQQGAGNASDTIHARVDQVREMGDEWAESLRTTVREHPLAALGTALALGLIIARLSR